MALLSSGFRFRLVPRNVLSIELAEPQSEWSSQINENALPYKFMGEPT